MSKECKCEHWQQCPVCMPHRFDSNGNLLPPEPTPLQAARIRIEELERDQLREQVKMLRGAAVLLFRESGASLTYSLADTVAQKAVREALAATEELK